MKQIPGLSELVGSPEYRSALGLPAAVTEEYRLLAQGEYNRNFRFRHPVTGKELLLRVNCGSQMHLEHQIEYESHALELLAPSGRTPRVLYTDGSKRYTDHGVSVMEYLPGRPLDYHRDLERAAGILADVHSVPLPGPSGLIEPADPLRAVLEECEEMLRVYLNSDLPPLSGKRKIRELLDLAWERYHRTNRTGGARCIVNTELNNTNFLMAEEPDGPAGGRDWLIDWEKPLWSDPAQDIAHFLVPTTTFWKTDVILSPGETADFLTAYEASVSGRIDLTGLRERLGVFMPVTCMRGVTWCAMAWVQYQKEEKELSNDSTRRKLEAYLSDSFLEEIRRIEEA
ncbi:MAG: aminoglycoside phosphotransferase family protein [Eubacterium pyruvativorans]|nr:aminoglycoside phosphotransferase family protein [Eubacterium pyruvativorans]MDY4049649.1 aminoglycoside phosphotransferase family protein [Eubacterium pyruvativorans]